MKARWTIEKHRKRKGEKPTFRVIGSYRTKDECKAAFVNCVGGKEVSFKMIPPDKGK